MLFFPLCSSPSSSPYTPPPRISPRLVSRALTSLIYPSPSTPQTISLKPQRSRPSRAPLHASRRNRHGRQTHRTNPSGDSRSQFLLQSACLPEGCSKILLLLKPRFGTEIMTPPQIRGSRPTRSKTSRLLHTGITAHPSRILYWDHSSAFARKRPRRRTLSSSPWECKCSSHGGRETPSSPAFAP